MAPNKNPPCHSQRRAFMRARASESNFAMGSEIAMVTSGWRVRSAWGAGQLRAHLLQAPRQEAPHQMSRQRGGRCKRRLCKHTVACSADQWGWTHPGLLDEAYTAPFRLAGTSFPRRHRLWLRPTARIGLQPRVRKAGSIRWALDAPLSNSFDDIVVLRLVFVNRAVHLVGGYGLLVRPLKGPRKHGMMETESRAAGLSYVF